MIEQVHRLLDVFDRRSQSLKLPGPAIPSQSGSFWGMSDYMSAKPENALTF